LSLSSLWSSISVTIHDDDDVERQVEGVEAWLGRSGIQPLAISLCLGDRYRPMDWGAEVDLDPIMDLFISFIGRWENVHFDLMGSFCGSTSSVHLLRAPLLRRFKVFGVGVDSVAEPLFSMLSASPHLTDLTLHGVCDTKVIHIAESFRPWSQLTRFQMHCLDVRECYKVLRLFPNLVDCTLESFALLDHPLSPVLQGTSIVHQCLRALTLDIETYDSDLDDFFDYLTLPALSTLVLILDGLQWQRTSFKAFLSRSGCSLNTIKLHTIALSTDEFVELLSLLPTLKELLIRGSVFNPLGDTLFRSLKYDETAEESCLCPELEVIDLGGFIAPSNGMLAQMLGSRYRSDTSQSRIACLQKVIVTFDVEYRLDKYSKELKEIGERGLDVEVKPCPSGYKYV